MIKKFLLGIVVVLVVAVAALLLFATTRPNTFHVERKISIAAHPPTVFAAVNDFHRWADWSPWEDLDPEMKKTYGGPESGQDATYTWAGNSKVGKGRMTIVSSEPDSRIEIRLEFLEPWQATNRTTFTFAPTDDGTDVTWSIDGANDLTAKMFSVFMDMDKMMGGDFEDGLAELKTVAESAPPDTNYVAPSGT